jgi:hypothetical protein
MERGRERRGIWGLIVVVLEEILLGFMRETVIGMSILC